MKVAIVGSRVWPNPEQIRAFVATLPENTIVVSGGARGVDSIAENAARRRGLSCHVIFADWDKHGKSAGYRRNVQVVEACDRVVAFWDGRSPGTKHTIDIATKAGKPVDVISP